MGVSTLGNIAVNGSADAWTNYTLCDFVYEFWLSMMLTSFNLEVVHHSVNLVYAFSVHMTILWVCPLSLCHCRAGRAGPKEQVLSSGPTKKKPSLQGR